MLYKRKNKPLNAETKNKSKKRGFFQKLFRFCLWAVIICALVVFGINGYVCLSAASNMKNADSFFNEKADCIVVLGCGVNGYSPSEMLKDRLDTAVALYKKGAADKLLMSGDHGGQYYNEVGVMKAYAMEQGVPSEDIFMDHAGFSTYETLYRAKEIFDCDEIIAVTQQYHLYRTVYLGKSLDIDITGVSSENYLYGGMLYREIREILARDKDFFTGIFKPEPAMPLGDKIDITGDGNVTNDDAFSHIAEIKGLSAE